VLTTIQARGSEARRGPAIRRSAGNCVPADLWSPLPRLPRPDKHKCYETLRGYLRELGDTFSAPYIGGGRLGSCQEAITTTIDTRRSTPPARDLGPHHHFTSSHSRLDRRKGGWALRYLALENHHSASGHSRGSPRITSPASPACLAIPGTGRCLSPIPLQTGRRT